MPASPRPSQLPEDLDALPTKGVAAFVRALAQERGVAYKRTRMDAWCDAVTRLSDDDVHSDETTDLLVALCRARHITADHLARLLTSHLREQGGQDV